MCFNEAARLALARASLGLPAAGNMLLAAIGSWDPKQVQLQQKLLKTGQLLQQLPASLLCLGADQNALKLPWELQALAWRLVVEAAAAGDPLTPALRGNQKPVWAAAQDL